MINEIEDNEKYILEMDARLFRHFSFCMGLACGTLVKEGLTEEAKKVYELQDLVRKSG